MRLLDAALEYAARGWPVYPVEAGGKRPLVKEWPTVASTDPAQLEAWWRRWPEASVAIVTGARSGVVAIDLDGDEVGGDNYGRLLNEHGLPGSAECTDGALVRTGREDGGWRLLLAIPSGVVIRKGTLAPGVEFMGGGGSAILPPSRHPSGWRYVWRTDPRSTLPELAPAWVALMAPAPRPATRAVPAPAVSGFDGLGTGYGRRALEGELARLAAAEPGTRNATLNAAAFAVGSLAAAGHLDAERAAEQLVRVAADIGLSEAEIRATLRSGLQAGWNSPRTAA